MLWACALISKTELQTCFRETTKTLILKWDETHHYCILHVFPNILDFLFLFSTWGQNRIWGCGYNRRLVMSKSMTSGKVASTDKKRETQSRWSRGWGWGWVKAFVAQQTCCILILWSQKCHQNLPCPCLIIQWNAQETFMELQHSAMQWECYRPLVKSMAGKALQQNKSSIGPCRSQPFHPLMWNRKQRIIWHRSHTCLNDRACTFKVGTRGQGSKTLLAALHEIVGPTGSAVPG